MRAESGALLDDRAPPPTVSPPSLSLGASEKERVELELRLFEEGGGEDNIPNYRFAVLGDRHVEIRRGGPQGENIQNFFYDDPPVIWFADGSSLDA